jgi:hypothetical protein
MRACADDPSRLLLTGRPTPFTDSQSTDGPAGGRLVAVAEETAPVVQRRVPRDDYWLEARPAS